MISKIKHAQNMLCVTNTGKPSQVPRVVTWTKAAHLLGPSIRVGSGPVISSADRTNPDPSTERRNQYPRVYRQPGVVTKTQTSWKLGSGGP